MNSQNNLKVGDKVMFLGGNDYSWNNQEWRECYGTITEVFDARCYATIRRIDDDSIAEHFDSTPYWFRPEDLNKIESWEETLIRRELRR